MRRFMLLAALCAALAAAMAPMAFGQTVETAPNNPDGTCPEGFVQVNAPFCAQESPNTPGRVFGYGEGDPEPQAVSPTQYESEAPVEGFPAICGANTLDQFPEGTVCTEGGGFILPEEVPVVESGLEEPAAPQATPVATTQALPATGGPSLALLAGALLIGAGLVLRRR